MTDLTNWRWIYCWVDGGVLEANPSPRGVYWSIFVESGGPAPAIVRCKDESGIYRNNNEAEWLAVREALRYVREHHRRFPICVHSDSRLVVSQFNGELQTNDRVLRHLRAECVEIVADLKYVAMLWRPRSVMLARLGH